MRTIRHIGLWFRSLIRDLRGRAIEITTRELIKMFADTKETDDETIE